MRGSRSLVSTSADDNDMRRKPAGWKSDTMAENSSRRCWGAASGEDPWHELGHNDLRWPFCRFLRAGHEPFLPGCLRGGSLSSRHTCRPAPETAPVRGRDDRTPCARIPPHDRPTMWARSIPMASRNPATGVGVARCSERVEGLPDDPAPGASQATDLGTDPSGLPPGGSNTGNCRETREGARELDPDPASRYEMESPSTSTEWSLTPVIGATP